VGSVAARFTERDELPQPQPCPAYSQAWNKRTPRQLWPKRFEFLGDVHAEGDDREDAARVIQVLLLRAHPTEADLADIIRALSRALGVHLAIRRVLGELQRLRPAEVEKVARSVEHLIDHALRERHDDALYQLVLISLEEPAWASRIRDEWGKAALVSVFERLPGSKYPVALLVGGWMCARGDVPEWMRELVENRPDLIASSVLPPATRWQLHRASPSVADCFLFLPHTFAGCEGCAEIVGWR